jgi:hypothetical protein
LWRVVGIEQSLPNRQLASRQRIELRRPVGFLQNRSAFGILMHGQQDFLQSFGERRRQIFSHGDQMTRQTGGLRQDGYLGFFVAVKRGVVVVAESSGRDFFREDQIDELMLRLGENVTDFAARDNGVNLSLRR